MRLALPPTSNIPKHTNNLERTLGPNANNLDLKKSLDYTY